MGPTINSDTAAASYDGWGHGWSNGWVYVWTRTTIVLASITTSLVIIARWANDDTSSFDVRL